MTSLEIEFGRLLTIFRHAGAVRSTLSALLVAVALYFFTVPAQAMKIQQFESPGGIAVWLVEEKSVPLISMNFGFRGGAVQDPADLPGVSYFLSGMLDEGAGDLNSVAFHERLEDLAVKLSFDASRDAFTGSFRTLVKNKDAAFELVRLALTQPRFDQDAIERIRGQILASLKIDQNDPSKVAAKAWFRTAFKDHPYGRSARGTVKTIKDISAADLRDFAKRVLTRETLKVAVVGDISAKELGELVDKTFGGLPEKSDLIKVPEAPAPEGPSVEVISMNIPQSVAEFGFAGIKRKDPDFIPAYILNYIVGGGGFASQLTEEVREKRGLAYSVYSYLYPFDFGSAFIGNVATQNKDMDTSLEVIRGVLKNIVEKGPTEKELADAKTYLTGSYALRFDTSSKISSQLMWIQLEELGVDYIEKRNGLIEAVTLDDLKRVAKRLIKYEQLIVTVVGQPDGVSNKPKANTDREG